MRRALAGLLALGGLLDGCGGRTVPGPAPDVVLVLLDTLRADRTSALPGGPPTPGLAALARTGTAYSQAVAPAAWTLPSMAALFAGRDASANRHAARTDLPALAEHFARAGYTTIGLVANPLLTAENGFSRGFGTYTVAPATSTADLAADVHALRAWDADAMVARALSLLADAPSERPVLLYLHLMDTHLPYDPAHGTRALPWPGWSAVGPADEPPLVHWTAANALDAEQLSLLTAWRRAYDGQVLFADAAVGRLVERLPEVRARPALVAVTSDHGEGLFSHRRGPGSARGPGPLGEAYPDHGEQLHEEALRVPLWLAGPGVPAGRVEARPVAVRDLGRTLLELSGTGEAMAFGSARLPLASSDPAPDVVLGAGTRGWFVRASNRKLVVPFTTRDPEGDPAVVLHAVASDRYLPETADLSSDEPEIRRDLLDRWRRWLASSDEPAPEPPDPDLVESLRMLGYVR